MHELSIAVALVETVRRAAPRGAVVRVVHVRAGPMRAIAPEALDWAWQAATADSELAGSTIKLDSLPWALHCPACGRDFTAGDLFAACVCGNETAHPVGEDNDTLQIMSLTIDDPTECPPHPEASATNSEQRTADQ